jgi:ATP-dependent RNA helicase SUPV3L1/SUV3
VASRKNVPAFEPRSLSAPSTGPHAASVQALLGPTNTGKTHHAIERMLEHRTGMLGFPLRLLAREVYDRLSARVGEEAVALITGEEKRVPRAPRYYVCTVEAMPLDVRCEFLAVDEIQLVAHPERGHVFTDRLLHARGTRETLFLGSDTAAWLLKRLLPGLIVTARPRLSKLTHRGRASLRSVPRRSAIVTFTMSAVYELADILRVRRGGAAVVLGALSPRVRNAQVALYQAGEVDFLVATDAIGMGLNLDIDHVALAARSKFDGFETRPLEVSELAQIVGRAGRHLRDGTFGTLAPEPELSPRLATRLESHVFPSLERAFFRSSALDFSSLPALLASLSVKPPRLELRPPPDGDDLALLRVLAARDDIRSRARTREAVRLAWDVCLIPNYEKLLPEHQAERMVPLYEELLEHGRIRSERVHAALSRSSRFDGDIHVLMDRLAAVRTWTYVSHQHGWVDDAPLLRERTRDLEDRLSDALHERLLERFVDTSRSARSLQRPSSGEGVASGPFAKLAALLPDEPARSSPQLAYTERVVAANYADMALDARGRLSVRDERLALLTRGQKLTAPALKLRLPGDLDGGARSRIERRLVAHLRDVLAQLKLPDALLAGSSPALRGLAYQLAQGLGTVPAERGRAQLEGLAHAERELLAGEGVVVGLRSVYLTRSIEPSALAARLALLRTFHEDGAPELARLSGGEVVVERAAGDAELWSAAGYLMVRGFALRCDVLEALALDAKSGRSVEERSARAASLLQVPDETARIIAGGLVKKRRKKRPTASP